jgi:hypothetical protein
LFLDEIGELDPTLQAKLLRALQDGEITRLSASLARKVSVRVIAGRTVTSSRRWTRGRFREDLYYRLSVFPIDVPPLRERRDDIPLLVWRAHILAVRSHHTEDNLSVQSLRVRRGVGDHTGRRLGGEHVRVDDEVVVGGKLFIQIEEALEEGAALAVRTLDLARGLALVLAGLGDEPVGSRGW